MALKRVYKKKFKGVNLKSGYFYKFKYRPYRLDPYPTIIFMHIIDGIHPNSGHQWRIIQAINFTYVPRAQRKKFLKAWMDQLEKPGNIKLHWKKILAKYPYIKMGIRRYQYKPSAYITKLEEIPLGQIQKEVTKTLSKDFSKKIMTRLRGLFFKKKQKREKTHRAKLKKKRTKMMQIEKKRKDALKKKKERAKKRGK
jgi:hypothetical protein